MDYHFKNFVFEGGGVKGIAYLGALDVLEQKGVLQNIERIGGTSAGAINAVLLGLNYSTDEVRDIIWSLNFNNFMDNSWGVLRDMKRLKDQFGWYKGDYFRNWIAQLIKAKTGNSESTFADIEALKVKKNFRSMYFMGTNLSTGFSEIFSAEHTPSTCIADAVRISMSIPLFFAAKRSVRGDLYVDGGVLDNFPIKLFDRKKYIDSNRYICTDYYCKLNDQFFNPDRTESDFVFNQETLGFRLDSKEEIATFRDHAAPPVREIDNFFDYTWALVNTLLEAQQSYHLHSDDWERTIYIDTLGVKTTDFDLKDTQKNALIKSGIKGATAYFDWYDKEKNKEIN